MENVWGGMLHDFIKEPCPALGTKSVLHQSLSLTL